MTNYVLISDPDQGKQLFRAQFAASKADTERTTIGHLSSP
jgi:hypothetical protein